jgi:hypothetical protein
MEVIMKKDTEDKKQENQRNDNEEKKGKNVLQDIGDQLGDFAQKTVETIRTTIERSLSGRNTVLSIRVSEDTSEKLGMLVEAGLFKSKSESAAFLIDEGIKKQNTMFKRVVKKMDEINKLRDELKNIVSEEIETK